MLLTNSKGLYPENGFTMPELLTTMIITAILSLIAYSFFSTSISQYYSLEARGTSLAELASQSQRVAQVLRGVTGITEASADDITCYAYFYPRDSYVSLIHYYKVNGNTELLADVTPMTSNPPSGTPINSEEKTFTIINNFYQVSGVSTFVYYDASNVALSEPITDLSSISAIQVNLAVPGWALNQQSNQQLSLEVELRNRKYNL